MVLDVFGYVGGSLIFMSRIIRPPWIHFSPSSGPFHPRPFPLISFPCSRRLRPVDVALRDFLQIRLNFRSRVSLVMAVCVLRTTLGRSFRMLVRDVIYIYRFLLFGYSDHQGDLVTEYD